MIIMCGEIGCVTEGNVSENLKKWRRQIEIYLEACGAVEKRDEPHVAIILHCAGPHVLEVFDQFAWSTDGDDKKPDKV